MIKKFRHLLKSDIHFKELLHGSIKSFGVKLFGTFLGFIATIITTRYYGADALGVASLVFVILNFVNIIGKVGLETASLKYVAQYHSQNKPELVKETYLKALVVIISVSIPLGIILYFIAPILANNVFHKPYIEEFIRTQGFLVTPLAITYLNFECLRGLKRVGTFMFFNSVSLYLFSSVIMLIVLFYYGGKFIPLVHCNSMAVMAQNLAVFITFVLSMIAWLRASNFFKVKVGHVIPYSELLNVAMPMLLASSIFF
ncbi:MAG: MATE family efflux transporter, partial [Bacteroidota bacterium]